MRINPTDAAALRAVLLEDLAAVSRLEQHLTTLTQRSADARKARFARRWHRELLEKMFLEVPPLRPAILAARVKPLLSDLLGFRHLFRHGYELLLDEAKTIFTIETMAERGQ